MDSYLLSFCTLSFAVYIICTETVRIPNKTVIPALIGENTH